MRYGCFARNMAWELVLLESIATFRLDAQSRFQMDYLLLQPHRFPSLYATRSIIVGDDLLCGHYYRDEIAK